MNILLTAFLSFFLFLLPTCAFAKCHGDEGAEDYCGAYREDAKTSFVTNESGKIVDFSDYGTLGKLLDLLSSSGFKDEEIRATYTNDQGHFKLPSGRVDEEMQNVVVTGWLHSVKKESEDRDFHVILGNYPTHNNKIRFMNVEVSGLPRNGSDTSDFKRARRELRNLLGYEPGGAFKQQIPAPRVRLWGSLFFDGGHQSGLANSPGPRGMKPSTVWEIHPIYKIEVWREGRWYEL